MRLPWRRRTEPADLIEEWMATAAGYADRLTETGLHCHLNDGSPRFCHWRAEQLPPAGPGESPQVGARCTFHPGGRHVNPNARLAPKDFTPTD